MLGPQTPRFDNPYSTSFVEFVRGRIHTEIEAFPAFVYNLARMKWEYENVARRIIVECLTAGFPNRLNDPIITTDWPHARCLLNADRTSGLLEVSWCPETDALRGGVEIDTIEFKVKAAPPNAARRMIRGILTALKGKTVADPEDNLAPTGRSDGGFRQPEMELTRTVAPAAPKPGYKQMIEQAQAKPPSPAPARPSAAQKPTPKPAAKPTVRGPRT